LQKTEQDGQEGSTPVITAVGVACEVKYFDALQSKKLCLKLSTKKAVSQGMSGGPVFTYRGVGSATHWDSDRGGAGGLGSGAAVAAEEEGGQRGMGMDGGGGGGAGGAGGGGGGDGGGDWGGEGWGGGEGGGGETNLIGLLSASDDGTAYIVPRGDIKAVLDNWTLFGE
jgi:hypothetical protein